MKIGFIGLGNMGFPIAKNILNAGYELVIYNRTSSKALPLTEKGALLVSSPFEVAEQTDVVFTVLADDSATESVVFGDDGILKGLKKGGIHVSISTISVACAKKIENAHSEHGQYFVSSTVLGRPDVAKAGDLRLLVAGVEQGRDKALPILKTFGDDVFIIGDEAYLANIAKLGNNFLLVSMLEAMAEALLFVEKNQVDPYIFLEIIHTFFDSPIYDNYGKMMVDKNFKAGFKMALGLKDINLMLAAGDSVSASLPLAELTKKHYLKGIEEGWGSLDWAALIKCIDL